jgi:hypothetical protein
MKHSEPRTTEPAAAPVGAAAAGVARRRLLRAGLAAAPVMAALKSNTVLAGGNGCVRPSAFASMANPNWALSGRTINNDYVCASPDHWKSSKAGLPKKFKKADFISEDTGFVTNPGGRYTKKSLQQVLNMNPSSDEEKLARYVTAALLSAASVSNDPGRVLLTAFQCREIWNEQGNWSPFGGADWTMKKTLHYFETVALKSQLWT